MTSRCNHPSFEKAFTLIELLIVIVIISLLYALGFNTMKMTQKKPKALTPLNMKKSIIQNVSFHGQATLLCVKKCKICYLSNAPHAPFKEYANPINLSHIEAYTMDGDEHLVPIEYGRFHDNKICLKMDFYNNGSSTQIILKKGEEVYFLPAYFGEPKAFDTLDEAQQYWLKNSSLLSDRGAYY